MKTPVVTPSEMPAFPMAPEAPSERFGAQVTALTPHLALSGLGCMSVEVLPGRRAFPFHNHLGKDEMFVILEGEGTYRFGARSFAIKAGDICAAPRGGPDTAHHLINTGDVPLRYLGISSSCDPDIVEYPDSGKFAAIGVAPGQDFFSAHLRYVGRTENSGDYWEGEDL